MPKPKVQHRAWGSNAFGPDLANGFYYLPTLFTDCHAQMTVVREEVFGPVITIERFTTEEDALRMANDTEYGLSAGFES